MTIHTSEKLAQHISDLGRAFNVRVEIDRGMAPDDAAAGYVRDTGQHVVRIAPVIDETTYVVALHELGHCIAPMGMLHHEYSKGMKTTNRLSTTRDIKLQLESERAAWEWAQHIALEWTPVMAYVKAMTLGSYEKTARRLLGRIP